jgi:hypothetical protein
LNAKIERTIEATLRSQNLIILSWYLQGKMENKYL